MGTDVYAKEVSLCYRAKGTPLQQAKTYNSPDNCNKWCSAEQNANQTIEVLRRELIRLVQETGSFTHDAVVELSQQLDVHIYSIQSKSRTLY